MARKGSNIYKRKDGRWEARYVKSISESGRKKYASVYAPSFHEAREKQLLCIQKGYINQKNNVTTKTLSAVSHEWLDTKSKLIKKSTYSKYECLIRVHIDSDTIGSIQLNKMNGSLIHDYTDRKIFDGNLSNKSINDVLMVIGEILSYANEKYGIQKPLFHFLRDDSKEMRVLSIAEQKKLEEHLCSNTDLYKFGVLLALYTGIRIGELCALEWSDVNDNSINICKTLHRIKNGNKTTIEITAPKTKSSNRIIPIPTCIAHLVEKNRSSGSVIKNKKGGIVEPRLMQITFDKFIAECGLPKTNFHALRHTFATRCVEAGVDVKTLSEILGHKDVKTTLNKYVHSSFEQKQRSMSLLNLSERL